MYLIDTNVVSELRDSARAHPGVKAWEATVAPSMVFLSAISLFEIEYGARLLERRDPRQGGVLRHWLHKNVVPAFEGRVLPVTAEVAVRCAALMVLNPRPLRDALIAATALVHGLTVVTRNVEDFEPTGVGVLNPWDA
jgi:predicted nucleic acid-binding protein